MPATVTIIMLWHIIIIHAKSARETIGKLQKLGTLHNVCASTQWHYYCIHLTLAKSELRQQFYADASFNALTLSVDWQKEHLTCRKPRLTSAPRFSTTTARTEPANHWKIIIILIIIIIHPLYTVSQKNVPPLACYDFDTHEWILIFFWQKCYR